MYIYIYTYLISYRLIQSPYYTISHSPRQGMLSSGWKKIENWWVGIDWMLIPQRNIFPTFDWQNSQNWMWSGLRVRSQISSLLLSRKLLINDDRSWFLRLFILTSLRDIVTDCNRLSTIWRAIRSSHFSSGQHFLLEKGHPITGKRRF